MYNVTNSKMMNHISTLSFKAVLTLFCCIDLFYSGSKDCMSRLLIYFLFTFVECRMDVQLELKNSLSCQGWLILVGATQQNKTR